VLSGADGDHQQDEIDDEPERDDPRKVRGVVYRARSGRADAAYRPRGILPS
jgi:hypothetical protein